MKNHKNGHLRPHQGMDPLYAEAHFPNLSSPRPGFVKANDPSMAKSNFDYSGPLSETIALGCVAIRMGEGAKLKWNSKKMTTGDRQADEYVRHEYRKGWKL
jgi:hypothetical protein